MEEVRITPLVWRVLVGSADFIVRMVDDMDSDCDAEFCLIPRAGDSMFGLLAVRQEYVFVY